MNAAPSELELKATVLRALHADRRITRTTILTSEYVLGRLPCRADLALWNGSDFVGVEIKSARDSLVRLPAQLTYYRACFDRVVIAADEKHIAGVLELARPSDEIWEIDRKGRATSVQGGTTLSGPADIRPRLQLLKLPQLKVLAENAGVAARRSRLVKIAEYAPARAINEALINSFCDAYRKSSSEFWNELGRRAISPDHIKLLSPYAGERRRVADNQREARAFWERWNAQANEAFGLPEPLSPPIPSPLRPPKERQPAHADGY